MLQSVLLHGTLERAALHGIGDNTLNVIVRQGVGIVRTSGGAALEDVTGHFGSFLVGKALVSAVIGVFAVGSIRMLSGFILKSDADHVLHDVLLLVAEGVVDAFYRLSITIGVLNIDLFFIIDHDVFVFGLVFVLGKFDLAHMRDDGFVIENGDVIRIVTVLNPDVIDLRAGVRASENKTNLTNIAVRYVLVNFLQPIGEDRQRVQILVLNGRLGVLTVLRVIEETVSIDTVRTGLQQNVSKNIFRVGMPMLPNKRNLLAVHVLESGALDRSAVGAPEICLSGIPTEVGFHFDSLLSTV